MTSNTSQQDAAVTDKGLLVGSAYADDRHLAARQSIYQWQQPRYDLPGIVTTELAQVHGTVLDIGCGNGKFITRLHRDRPDLRVVGTDISAGILHDVPRPVAVADAQALPFAVVDCGVNLERITCPHCGGSLDTDWWSDLLEEHAESGFTTLVTEVPCCGAATSLDALDYDWPCGFARFEIAVWNPERRWFSAEDLTALGDVLGHPVRQIRAHI